MSKISPDPYFHLTNGQNLVGEHYIEGVPASLYNLTKSVPDPLSKTQSHYLNRSCTVMLGSCRLPSVTEQILNEEILQVVLL